MVALGFFQSMQLLSYFVRCLPTRVDLMYSTATSLWETETKRKKTILSDINVAPHLNGKSN